MRNLRLPFVKENVRCTREWLAREITAAFRCPFAGLDLCNAFLFEPEGFAPIGCIQRLPIPDAMSRHVKVPVSVSFLDHFAPLFGFDFPLPLGRPPNLPHSCMRFTNSRLPHFLMRASALRRPFGDQG